MRKHVVGFPAAARTVRVKRLWLRHVPGLLTDLNLSADGSTVLVATIPDRDSLSANANRTKHFAVLYSKTGKKLAEIQMPSQIKAQTLSADGKLAVISSYDDEIRGFDRSGRKLWQTEGFCRPTLLSKLGRILCFHDDDAEPNLGFEVFDLKGKKVDEFPIRSDALVLKVAPDQGSFVMALTHGQVIVFNSRFKPILHKWVHGEVVDVAISDRKHGKPAFAVLYNPWHSRDQRVAYFGRKYFNVPLSDRVDQIELSPDGSALFGYGNTGEGQFLTRIAKNKARRWKRVEKASSEYTFQIAVTRDTVWMGYQDEASMNPRNYVLGFDFSGGLKSELRVPADEGAYLYTFSVAPDARRMAVGSDDAHLSFFDLGDQ